MNKTVWNYLSWIVVIGFLISPPILVRDFTDIAPVIRIVSFCLLTGALSSMGLYLTFRRGDIVAEMPISKQLKTEKGRRVAGLFFRGLSALMVIGGIYLLVHITPSVASYSLGWAAAVNEVHMIRQVRSPAVPGAAYTYVSILTDDKRYLSFAYPDQTLQAGHKYIFTLLPDSDFVLAAKIAD
jgi:hypothetical protein